MKNIGIVFSALFLAGVNANAYFDGGASVTTGPDDYRGTRVNAVIGSGNIALEPSFASYTSDSLDKIYKVYALRGAVEADKYTVGAEAGVTPEVNDYSNKFAGGDITISLTPGGGGKSRLAGPGARNIARGGEGVTRIDVGAGLKHTRHEYSSASPLTTDQTQYSLFAGAKILMANLSASWTGYRYGAEEVTPLINPVPGHSFAYGATPKSSVNARLDLPGFPMVTPFVSYTGSKYKNGVDESSAYLFGAYLDLNMIVANIGYQIFDNGHARDSFISLGAGIKF
jgi:hypothetical protein